jgi:hypothetical protein
MDKKTNPIMIIESLRAGIPTHQSIRETRDLRPDILQKVENDLMQITEGKSCPGKIIWGEYGQGKTHSLKQIETLAKEKNFAVSYLSVSRELPFANFFSLFERLTGCITTPGTNIPGLLNHFVKKGIHSSDFVLQIRNELIHPLPAYLFYCLGLVSSQDELLVLYNCLCGSTKHITAAKKILKNHDRKLSQEIAAFKIAEHKEAFIQFFPKIISFLGFNGWVILLDEMELIGRLGKISRLKSYLNLIKLLNWDKKKEPTVYTLCGCAKTLQEDVFFDNRHNDSEMIPQLASERAMSDSVQPLRKFFVQAVKENKIDLYPVKYDMLITVLKTIYENYLQVFTWQNPPSFDQIIQSPVMKKFVQNRIREVIRSFIEYLDTIRLYGFVDDIELDIHNEEYNLSEKEEEFSSEED